jgi:methanogenic corrinoid protein MtbC1
MAIQNALIEKIRIGDRSGANSLLDTWASEYGYDHLVEKVLEPMLMTIGEEWKASEAFTLAQVYVTAKVAEDILNKIAAHRESQAASIPSRGPVIIGNIEDDFHALGRRMVGTFLRADGWAVHDLGNDIPAALFVDRAQEIGDQLEHCRAPGSRRRCLNA